MFQQNSLYEKDDLAVILSKYVNKVDAIAIPFVSITKIELTTEPSVRGSQGDRP